MVSEGGVLVVKDPAVRAVDDWAAVMKRVK